MSKKEMTRRDVAVYVVGLVIYVVVMSFVVRPLLDGRGALLNAIAAGIVLACFFGAISALIRDDGPRSG